jgi:hypothetical protein
LRSLQSHEGAADVIEAVRQPGASTAVPRIDAKLSNLRIFEVHREEPVAEFAASGRHHGGDVPIVAQATKHPAIAARDVVVTGALKTQRGNIFTTTEDDFHVA